MSTALLVIDMQLGGFDGEHTSPMTDSDQLIANVNSVIDACRQKNLPVVFIQHSNPPGNAFGPDTNGWQIHPALHRQTTDPIVQKQASDAFEDTTLDSVLIELDATEIIVCGLQSEFCVTNTSKGAFATGRSVTVVSDAHGTQGADAHAIIERQNNWLASKGANLQTTQTLKHYLSSK